MKQNPFADYGAIVSGNRFIGRKHELNRLKQRVLLKEGFGNFAIMGLPRIGKSSLMWEGVMSKEAELLADKTIPIWCTASGGNNTFWFLRAFCHDVIKKCARIAENENLKAFLDEVKSSLRDIQNKEDLKAQIIELLKELKYMKYKIILLIDEFDAVQDYMGVEDFGFLRQISYELDKKICIVTTSRKTIKDIEAVSGEVSNFFGTFDTLRLGLFDEDSLDLYWQWVKDQQPPFEVTDDYISDVAFKVGAHPLLLDFYNYYHWSQDDNNMLDDSQDFDIHLIDLFDTMQGTLAKEKLMDASIQLIVGPIFDITSDQKKALEAYNFIKPTRADSKAELLGGHYGPRFENNIAYECFSPFLTIIFTYQHLFDIPYWPEWQKTEICVRGVIKKYVSSLGPNWEEQLCSRFGSDKNWLNNFNALKSLRNRSLKRFPNASSHLVDYTLPANMFSLFIGPAWGDYFANVFLGVGSDRSGNREEWKKKFQLLTDIRNPSAHSNGVFVDQEEINMAKQYCKAITHAIAKWEQKR